MAGASGRTFWAVREGTPFRRGAAKEAITLMHLKKWLALLVSAALTLTVLAGCGGSHSVTRVILNLLEDQYANVTVEMDSDLEAALRRAVRENDTEAEVRAALEKTLGATVSFSSLGNGQQGESGFSLIFYPGSDSDAAARSAFTEWNKVFGSLPKNGQYSAGLAMIETENGYYILVQATVDKAGTQNDDGPEDTVITGTGFTYNVTKKTITVELDSKGMQELFFNNADTKVEAARSNGFEDIIITLKTGTYSVSQTFETPFKGTLQGESGATITLTGGSGLFAQIAGDGTVENLNITVAGTISNDSDKGKAGAVAGENNGTISGCTVTIDTSGSISATDEYSNAGGIVGYNYDEISGCEVTINSSISGGYAGGIAGYLPFTGSSTGVTACRNSGTVQLYADQPLEDSGDGQQYVQGVIGGIVACAQASTAVQDCSNTGSLEIPQDLASLGYAGDLVGYTFSNGEPILGMFAIQDGKAIF